jgi:hypothetical protein
MMFDIGIVDICHATDAVFLFWQPMLDWVEDHTYREAPEEMEQLAASHLYVLTITVSNLPARSTLRGGLGKLVLVK